MNPSAQDAVLSASSANLGTGKPLNVLTPQFLAALPDVIVSRMDISNSLEAYENLITTAKAYRTQLQSLAQSASDFGTSLEVCARSKGCSNEASSGLLVASGMQQLIANHHLILAETLYRQVEVPLLHDVDMYKAQSQQEEESYIKEAKERGRLLRKREDEHLKLAKQKRRDMVKFRAALMELAKQIDDMDHLKLDHYRSVLTLANSTSEKVLSSASLFVRAETEIFESVAKKGWSGGGLEAILSSAKDWSTADETQETGIFSILPHRSILAYPQSPRMEIERPRSLNEAFSDTEYFMEDDATSIFSSTQPIASIDGVMADSGSGRYYNGVTPTQSPSKVRKKGTSPESELMGKENNEPH